MSDSQPDAAADGTDGARFGRYRVVSLLGTGGMASVFRAVDTGTGHTVALKVMSHELEADPEYRARFVREARMLQGIRHPNVVMVMDAGEQDGRPYFAMECLTGEDLEQRIRRDGPLAWRLALELMRQSLQGLAAAWAAGLIHRDVKPENLFVASDGVLKVMDFGVARPLLSDGFQTQAGMVVGTPAYIAPEQAMGRKVDLRADLYSLGATFFHIITGRTPYGEAPASELCASHVYDPFPPINRFVPDLPRGVVDLFARLAEKDPVKRGDQLAALAAIDALLGVTGELPVHQPAGPALLIVAGNGAGTRAPLADGQEVLVGRMPGCGLTIDDARASRRHALVVRHGATAEIRDLGSRNGVQVNGQPVALSSPLRDGDTFVIGETVVRVEGLSTAPAPSFRVATLPPVERSGSVSQRLPPSARAAAPRQAAETVHPPDEQATFESLAGGRVRHADPQPGHLVVLARLVAAVRAAQDPAGVGPKVLQIVVEAIPVDRAFLLVPTGNARAGVAVVASRGPRGEAAAGGPDAELVRRAWERGESVMAAGEGAPSVVAAPLPGRPRAAGVLYLERAAPHCFAVADQALAEAVAEFTAHAFGALPPAPPREREFLLAMQGPASRARLEAASPAEWAEAVAPRVVPAAVLFCDLRDLPALALRQCAADAAALLAEFTGLVEEALAAEGGMLVRGGAEECLGVFGAPVAMDHPSVAAVRAGVAVLQRVASWQRGQPPDRRLRARVGVSTGNVVAGACTTPRQRGYSVLGEPAVLAAAMARHGGPSSLLITESTWRDLRGAVPTVSRGPLAGLPGVPPVTIYEVLPPTPVPRT